MRPVQIRAPSGPMEANGGVEAEGENPEAASESVGLNAEVDNVLRLLESGESLAVRLPIPL